MDRVNRSRGGTVLCVLWSLGAATAPAEAENDLLNSLFRRGDANLDGGINLSDASFLLTALFLDGPGSGCLDAADVNDDGALDDKDPLYLLDWLFPRGPGQSPPPPPPFQLPGLDPTLDGIDCLLSIIRPPGDPAPGVKLELQGPELMARGQRGLALLLSATTTGPIDGFSIALSVDRQAIRVSGADLEETIFPSPLRSTFESSGFFRWTVIEEVSSPRDLLLVAVIFMGPDHQRIRFPATSGAVSGAPLLRLLVDVAPDAPLGERTVLENAPPPPDLAGLLTELTGGGSSIRPETLPSYRVKLVEAGELILSRRADANSDRLIDIADPTFTLSFLFLAGTQPTCQDSADANDDGVLDIADPIYTLYFLFAGGQAPPPPYPHCGVDRTADALPVCREACDG